MSLDNNERSNYKARELKSVFITATGNYIKFVIHKCYINPENLYNQVSKSSCCWSDAGLEIVQVGIIAFNIIGERSSSAAPGKPSSGSTQWAQDMGKDMSLDSDTANALREVYRAKVDAVEQEDFDRVSGARAPQWDMLP